MSYFIGLDISTTATKALLMDAKGAVIGVATSEYRYDTPKPLWSEQNPALWWRATVNSMKQVVAGSGVPPNDIRGIGLTGQMHGLVLLDKAGGAGTILFDLKRRDWSAEVVAALNINPEWLPPAFEGTAITGQLSPQGAAATGLPAGIPLVGGADDQAANAVGTGAVVEGIVALSLGTSGVVFASAGEPIVEPEGRLHAFCHAAPGLWHLMGVMLSAGGSLRWYRDTLAPGVSYDDLLAPAAGVPAGCDGLYFLPYLTGERTPHPDPLARGAFAGLTVRHTRAHMTRAVLEGVSFGLRDSFELMEGAGLANIRQVRISGGGARSILWRQILADVLQAELVTVNTTEGAAYGAALLAATGVGAFPSVEAACDAAVKISGATPPGPGSEVYQESYPQYRELYPGLKPLFK